MTCLTGGQPMNGTGRGRRALVRWSCLLLTAASLTLLLGHWVCVVSNRQLPIDRGSYERWLAHDPAGYARLEAITQAALCCRFRSVTPDRLIAMARLVDGGMAKNLGLALVQGLVAQPDAFSAAYEQADEETQSAALSLLSVGFSEQASQHALRRALEQLRGRQRRIPMRGREAIIQHLEGLLRGAEHSAGGDDHRLRRCISHLELCIALSTPARAGATDAELAL